MPYVSKAIPNLINGISQQPASLRLPSQAEQQENLYPSVVEGLKDRPPVEHISRIYNGTLSEAFTHPINRDATQRYNVLVTNGALQVNDLAGVVKAVAFPDGVGYLTSASPATAFRAVTVADYTFLVNREVEVAMTSAKSPVRPKEAMVFVKQGNYGSVYTVRIDGIVKATYTTSTTDVADLATDNIANHLRVQLAANLGVGFTTYVVGSTITIVLATGDFALNCTDSQGGASLFAFKETTQSFSSLPTTAFNGFRITVENSPGSEIDNYYLAFSTIDGGDFSEGIWQETVAPDMFIELDATTMPHVLIRNVDDTFTFQEATWEQMTAGDGLTAPPPSFVTNTIRELGFFKNRLMFFSEDNVILSGVGKYFNYFKTTVTTSLDDDPIDSPINHTKVSIINHAEVFDSDVILFSDQTQFRLTGNPTLTAKTISILPMTEFESSEVCRPLGAGRRIYFTTLKGAFTGMREYAVDQTTATKDAADIAGHIPTFIPAGAFKLIGSTIEDVVAVLTTGDRTSLYLYKYYYSGDEKLQSAWCRLKLGNDDTVILGAEFVQTTLYLTVQRADGVYFEKMNFAPGVVDTGVDYVTHVDRRITNLQCTAVVYDALYDTTTYTLPYVITGTMLVVTRLVAPGAVRTYTQVDTDKLRLNGDTTTLPLWLGQTFRRSFIPSTVYMREQPRAGSSGGPIIMEGRLQIRHFRFLYSKTGYFQVTVTPAYRDPSVFTFTGKTLGQGSNIIGGVNLPNGTFSVLAMSRNDQVTVEVSSESYLPMHLLGMEWDGFFHAHSRRV